MGQPIINHLAASQSTFLVLAMSLFFVPLLARSLTETPDQTLSLTSLSACADPRFTCADPVEVRVPATPGLCSPYPPSLADVRGSFVITWADADSLPSGASLAVCTEVEVWTLPGCHGDKFTVSMSPSKGLHLEVRSEASEKDGGGMALRLGYSGPWKTEASFYSFTCAKVAKWHTLQTQVTVHPSKEMQHLQGSEEIHVATSHAARRGAPVCSTLGIALGAVVGFLATVGAALAYYSRDSLAEILAEAQERACLESKTSPLDTRGDSGKLLDRNLQQVPAAGHSLQLSDGEDTVARQPNGLILQSPLKERLLQSRPLHWLFAWRAPIHSGQYQKVSGQVSRDVSNAKMPLSPNSGGAMVGHHSWSRHPSSPRN